MKKLLKLIGILLALVILVVGGYLAYVFLSFDRIDDNLKLEVTHDESVRQEMEADKEMTIISYNIGFGAYSDDYTFFMDGGEESRARSPEAVHDNIAGAMKTVTTKKPDFVLIQEIDIDGTRSHHIDERTLVEPPLLKLRPYDSVFAQNYDSPYLMYPITEPHGANKAGIMTFSAYPVTESLRRQLPIETGLSKVLDLDRCYSKSRIKAENGKEFILYNFHLSAYTSDPATAENQLKMVIEDMQKEYNAGNYCLAGGDFNRDLLGNSPEIFGTATLDDNWAKPINKDLFNDDIILEAPLDEQAMVASCRNPDKPYEKGDFVVTIDGFIHSANVEVARSRVIDTGFKYSDHNPVIMQFKLKK